MDEQINWIVYVKNYKDLQNAGINTSEKALNHWNMWGKQEGRTFQKIDNVDYDLYLFKSNLINYIIINNVEYVNINYCLQIVNKIKADYSNYFDVDTFFYLTVNKLFFNNENNVLKHIYNHGVSNGLIYHPKQLLNIFPDIKIREENSKIFVVQNEKIELISDFVTRELYIKDFDWYINQIEMKENTLIDNTLLLIVFIGNENIGNNLLNKILSYKKIQNFSIGVCFRTVDLYEKLKDTIFNNFYNYALFISKEYGNDIIPSLIMYNKINNLIKFDKIIKLHTKSSDMMWYNDVTDFLLNRKSEELEKYKSNMCNCIGPTKYYTVINTTDNINTIKKFSKHIDKSQFIRGSIFFCDKVVIDKIIKLMSTDYKMFFNNNLYDTNIINLLYSPVHSLERFFGIIKI